MDKTEAAAYILKGLGIEGWLPSDIPPCCQQTIEDHIETAENAFNRLLAKGDPEYAAEVLALTKEWLVSLSHFPPPGLSP